MMMIKGTWTCLVAVTSDGKVTTHYDHYLNNNNNLKLKKSLGLVRKIQRAKQILPCKRTKEYNTFLLLQLDT